MLQAKHLSVIYGSFDPQSLNSVVALVSLSLLTWAACLGVANAESGQTKVSISATIQKHASLKVLNQAPSVIVTAADISKGYVDVSVPATVQVKCNTPDGVFLMFESQGEFISQTLVNGLANTTHIAAAGGGVVHSVAGSGMRESQLDLGFRFILAASARPGVYPWPMRLSVVPL